MEFSLGMVAFALVIFAQIAAVIAAGATQEPNA
jgi:hypothetical protein